MDAANRRATMQAGTMQAEGSYAYDNANRSTGVTKGRPVSRSSMTQIPAHDLDAAERGSPPTYTWDAASQLTAISYAVGATNPAI